jgi:hypothetical protein
LLMIVNIGSNMGAHWANTVDSCNVTVFFIKFNFC